MRQVFIKYKLLIINIFTLTLALRSLFCVTEYDITSPLSITTSVQGGVAS